MQTAAGEVLNYIIQVNFKFMSDGSVENAIFFVLNRTSYMSALTFVSEQI